ncbi:hypothetical protein FOVSG1_008996 [Fusarium oxysporum f. sp. vasinfectum]
MEDLASLQGAYGELALPCATAACPQSSRLESRVFNSSCQSRPISSFEPVLELVNWCKSSTGIYDIFQSHVAQYGSRTSHLLLEMLSLPSKLGLGSAYHLHELPPCPMQHLHCHHALHRKQSSQT